MVDPIPKAETWDFRDVGLGNSRFASVWLGGPVYELCWYFGGY
jgi:hypothetical protein